MHDYDRSSKWLIEHFGRALLQLAGFTDVVACKPLQAEVVQPRRLPDGLLEAQLAGRADPDLFLLEIATYPDRRIAEQVFHAAVLTWLDRGVIPEAITVVLYPRGQYRVSGSEDLNSRLSCTQLRISWRVVELWHIQAAHLLAANDVGLIPWVPLTQFDGPPEPLLHQCRQRIDAQAAGDLHENLLVVTQVLMRLRYNDPQFFAIFGGSRVMIESPLIKEIVDQTYYANILRVLSARLGSVPMEIVVELKKITDKEKLDHLVEWAAQCPSLESFQSRVAAP